MYLYNSQKDNNSKTNIAPQNPFAPSIKPSDIIEKSTKTSADWLDKSIKKDKDEDHGNEEDNN